MAKKQAPPLILEEVQDQSNLLFLCLIEFKKEKYLTLIDNIKDDEISAYVLDHAEAEGLDVQALLSVATHWYYRSSEKYPISFELAKLGLSDKTSKILRTFSIDYVSRMIGKIFVYELDSKPKVRRKRVNVIPSYIEIKLKKNAGFSVKSGDNVDFYK